MRYLAVMAGGALGALSRFGMSQAMVALNWTKFPWATLTVNVVGCLVMGFLAEFTLIKGCPSPLWRDALGAGFLGALTTYSTFNTETLSLFHQGKGGLALANLAGTLVLCLAAGLFGIWAARNLLG